MPKVTLTFDNGPTPETTPQVLDCLSRHDVKATFFVVGSRACSEAGASLVRRASQEGHWIGNHTFSHRTPLGELDGETAVREVERAQEVLSHLVPSTRLFRPYARAGRLGRHLLHPAVIETLQSGKYTCVLWNCVPGDWRDPEGWQELAMAHYRSHPWSLIVLHDQPGAAMAHLDRFLGQMRDEGVELRQDFPSDCVPIVEGNIVHPLDPYTAEIPQ